MVSPQQGRMKALELLQLVSFSVPGVRPLPRGSAAALAQMIDLRNFATVSARYKVYSNASELVCYVSVYYMIVRMCLQCEHITRYFLFCLISLTRVKLLLRDTLIII